MEARRLLSSTEPASGVYRRPIAVHRLATAIVLAGIALVAIRRLPPGICFGDSGDLQVAAATLTTAHPPGYGGLASVGHLLGLIPWLEPAYAVTLGCLASGIIALALVAALQVRLGAAPIIAVAVTLGLAGSTRVWEALVVPEVYAPNLALHAGAVWFLVTYLERRDWRRLALMGLCLGFALANRPSTLASLPGFALALLVHWRQSGLPVRRWLSAAAVIFLTLVLPCVYTLGYYYVRDHSGTPVNLIENRRITHGDLPEESAGPAAKVQRVLWLATARDFRDLLGGSPTFMAGRTRLLIERLGLSNDIVLVVALCATVIGGALAWRRCGPAAIALIGLALGAAAFFCAYNVYDTAADVLPIIFVASIFVGLCVSALLRAKPTFDARALGVLVCVAVGVCVKVTKSETIPDAAEVDATHFVPAAELRDLPQNAAVFSDWIGAAPLRYAQYQFKRPDLMIVFKPRNPRELARRLNDGGRGRPVFSTLRFDAPEGYEARRCGALWQIAPTRAMAGEIDAATPERYERINEGGQQD